MDSSRTLYLLRHAEAEAGSPDWRRSLTRAGKAAAKTLGRTMKERGYAPAAVWCSEARRTRETLSALEVADAAPVFRKEIYSASPGDLLTLLQGAGDVSSLLLIGHNPAIHAIASTLAGAGDEGLRQTLNLQYAPATLTVLQFNGAWAELGPDSGRLVDLIIPPAEGRA